MTILSLINLQMAHYIQSTTETPLAMAAARHGHHELVNYFIKQGSDLDDACNPQSYGCFTCFAEYGCFRETIASGDRQCDLNAMYELGSPVDVKLTENCRQNFLLNDCSNLTLQFMLQIDWWWSC